MAISDDEARPDPRFRWELYTEPARRVIAVGQGEARELGREQIESEHLLLGLLLEGDGLAARALARFDVEANRVRRHVLPSPGAQRADSCFEPLSFSTEVESILQAALRLSISQQVDYIGTEHLLTAVLDSEGQAVRILQRLGTDPAALRSWVLARATRPPAQ